jgi:hypothetical protein
MMPTCRYGHGPLVDQAYEPDMAWSLNSVKKKTHDDGQYTIENGPFAFVFRLFRCPTCGYLELFDDES